MKNIFVNKRKEGTVGSVAQMNELLQQNLNGSNLATVENARLAISSESLTDSQYTALTQASDSLAVSLENIVTELGLEGMYKDYNIQAGVIAGMLGGDYKNTLGSKLDYQMVSTESMAVIQPNNVADAFTSRSFGLESYDERENRQTVNHSIIYNVQATLQDEFGETFFPTIVVSPDNAGVSITVDLMMVYDGIERSITGSFADFKKKNILRAVADYTVLHKDKTRIVPVNRAQSLDKFVDPLLVPAYSVDLEGESIHTAPLAIGKKLDIISLSQTDTLLTNGVMDQTDTLDPYITLQNAYIKIGDDVLKIPTINLPLANFIYSPQDNYRVMNLNFHTTSILINKDTKQADGSALVSLASVVTNDLIVRVELAMSGSANIEFGNLTVYGNTVGVYSVSNNTGVALDLAASPSAALVTAISAGTIFGYDIQAYRTNRNLRQRGQLIDVTKFNTIYNIPLRSPIAVIHPISDNVQSDNSDIQSLVVATHIRINNEAVTSVINTAQLLSEYVDARDNTGVGPDILGVGRFYVKPTYRTEVLDMATTLNSLSSIDRPEAIQSAIVNKIRDYAYGMYRDSEYKAAADAFATGVPTVIIGTDPVIAKYLMVTGDLRTLGGEFDQRIVSTLDKRVRGKIFITFGVFNDNRNAAPNPLNFGNLAWSPELVLNANISRNGSISKDIIVQPRYLFITHLPIMGVIEVQNIPEVTGSVPLQFKSV